MEFKTILQSNRGLILGDTIALAIITVLGFASHGEAETAYIPRMFTTLIPLVISWFLIAPWMGLFNPQLIDNGKQLWRPPLATLLASPMTAILRASMLKTVALPLFTLVLGVSAAVGMFVWRWLNYFWHKKTM